MGKGDKRGKNRHRNEQDWMAELEKVPRPKKRGKARMMEIEAAGPPQEAAGRLPLETRCRRMGWAVNADNLKRAESQVLIDQFGCVITAMCSREEAAILWETWQSFAIADRSYHALKLGMSHQPKGAAIAMVRDRFEVGEANSSSDPRDFDDRLRAAVSRWMIWQGRIQRLSPAQRTLINDVLKGRGENLWDEKGQRWAPKKPGEDVLVKLSGAPTIKGLRTLIAMRKLTEVSAA